MGAPQAGSADGSPAIAGTHEVVDATNDIASAASKSKTASSNAKFQARGSISGATIPLSVRKSEPLDLSSVERKGSPSARPAISHGPVATIAGLREAPIFRPTQDEFLDPLAYIRSLRDEGSKSGIVKIVPPDNWNPPFAIDTEVRYLHDELQKTSSIIDHLY